VGTFSLNRSPSRPCAGALTKKSRSIVRADPAMSHAMANLVMDATPDFYLENIKRCVEKGIQPYFALPHVHGLELVERLIRRGYYMGR
jgi:hypothetical protein